MTMPRYRAMCDYWRDWPPLHMMVASFMGHKPRAKISEKMPEFLELPEYEE